MKKKMTKGSAMILAALEKEGVELVFGFPRRGGVASL
jgi:thiamine pyrophosphate-dependent acetolactate synthase large subunit-like protein